MVFRWISRFGCRLGIVPLASSISGVSIAAGARASSCLAALAGRVQSTCYAQTAGSMDFRDKRLYHQIHPLKLATDIAVTPISLFFLWHHRIAPALVVGLVPPVAVSAAMMIWPPDLERLKTSPLGKYISRYMTPAIEVVRLLTLIPMVLGAWIHDPWFIALGLLVLLLAWCYGLAFSRLKVGF